MKGLVVVAASVAAAAMGGLYLASKIQRAIAPAKLGPPPTSIPQTEAQLRTQIKARFIPKFNNASAPDSRIAPVDVLAELFGDLAKPELKPYRPWLLDWAIRELAANNVDPAMVAAARKKVGI